MDRIDSETKLKEWVQPVAAFVRRKARLALTSPDLAFSQFAKATEEGLERTLPTSKEFSRCLGEFWTVIEPKLGDAQLTPENVAKRVLQNEPISPRYWKLIRAAHDYWSYSPLIAQCDPVAFNRRLAKALSAVHCTKNHDGSAEQRSLRALSAHQVVFEQIYRIYLAKMSLLHPLSEGRLPSGPKQAGTLCRELGAVFNDPRLVDPDAGRWRNAHGHGHVEYLGRNWARLRNVNRHGKEVWCVKVTTAQVQRATRRMMAAVCGFQCAMTAFVTMTTFEIFDPILPHLGPLLRGELAPEEVELVNLDFLKGKDIVYGPQLDDLWKYFGRGEKEQSIAAISR